MHRILHIIPALNHSGTAKQLALLAAGLPKDEFEIHVVALNAGGGMSPICGGSGIEPVVIGRRWRIDPMAFWRLRRHIRRLRPDLVHTWLFEANTYGRAAATFSRCAATGGNGARRRRLEDGPRIGD